MTELVVDDPGRPRRKRVATIAKRAAAIAPLSDATCTPGWLADLLPDRDFDPCSNPRSVIRALWAWSLEKGINGLKMPWRGTGFVNWPYSNPAPWADKAMLELSSGCCTDLIILCKFDPSTKWWKTITSGIVRPVAAGLLRDDSTCWVHSPCLPDLWMFDDRIQFDEHPDIIARRRDDYARARELYDAGQGPKPTGKQDGSSTSNFVSVIIHHRAPDAAPLSLRQFATLWRQVS